MHVFGNMSYICRRNLDEMRYSINQKIEIVT